MAVCCSSDFGEFARALLLRLEQPRVLDGDHRLVGEGLDQLDLLLGERPYGSALQDKHANWNPLTKKWHAEDCAKVAESCEFTEGVFRISKNIRNLNGFALQQNSADYTAASRCKYRIFCMFIELGRVTVACCYVVACILPDRSEDCALIGLAQTCRRLDQRVEHLRQIECRAADDLEHIGGGGLLLQRFRKLTRALLSASNSRVFSMAITAWSAKVSTSSICFSVNGRLQRGRKQVTPIGSPPEEAARRGLSESS